jgi:hypothetical protein
VRQGGGGEVSAAPGERGEARHARDQRPQVRFERGLLRVGALQVDAVADLARAPD